MKNRELGWYGKVFVIRLVHTEHEIGCEGDRFAAVFTYRHSIGILNVSRRVSVHKLVPSLNVIGPLEPIYTDRN